MKLPWVGREAYELLLDHYNADSVIHQEALAKERQRSEMLLARVLALQAEGHRVPPQYPDYIDQPKTVDEEDEQLAKREMSR